MLRVPQLAYTHIHKHKHEQTSTKTHAYTCIHLNIQIFVISNMVYKYRPIAIETLIEVRADFMCVTECICTHKHTQTHTDTHRHTCVHLYIRVFIISNMVYTTDLLPSQH